MILVVKNHSLAVVISRERQVKNPFKDLSPILPIIFRFAQALEVVPRVLAENSGVKPKEVISSLYAAHAEGNKNVGFDIEGEGGDVKVLLFFHSFK